MTHRIPNTTDSGEHRPMIPGETIPQEWLDIASLISDDPDNGLTLDGDGKLVVPPGTTEGVTQGPGWVQLGTILFQWGSGQAPSRATRTTTLSVTFPRPFTAVYHVGLSQRTPSVGQFGIGATQAVTGFTPGSAANGFVANFNSADDGGGSGYTIQVPISFTWFAIGLGSPT